MMRLLRLIKILSVTFKFGLDEFILGHTKLRGIKSLVSKVFFWRNLEQPRGERLRLALESLGPIFVKFGQMLSTRRDLIPLDLADELALLQDRVPPFLYEEVEVILKAAYQAEVDTIFAEFDRIPVASASVAQVHFAKLLDGREVAVKVLRPGIERVIAKDIALLESAASLVDKLWSDGKRLKPREVVGEFAKYLENELDLMLEAANCSLLRRNFIDGKLLEVPEVYWDYCYEKVMVMQRMDGIPINKVSYLREIGVDIPKLARDGVQIFFTQVFRDGFFHADMHPGNVQVARDGHYIALDFGIMGSLNEVDKQYLARNFLAFFRRDYREVAMAHIESGWAPKDTPADQFETAIRAVCEPIFDKPLKDISFGKVLLRLFQTSRRFGVEIQPQLVMLQKTLLNIEGLGRDLDPELDLWVTAKPFLERWMSEQVGWRSVVRRVKSEAPVWGSMLPMLPRALDQYLRRDNAGVVAAELAKIKKEQKRQTLALGMVSLALFMLLLIEAFRCFKPLLNLS